jgi:2-iminobutanoate/2-iminopropanoate deaminase
VVTTESHGPWSVRLSGPPGSAMLMPTRTFGRPGRPGRALTMTRHAVSTDHAPAALGAYSQAIVAGGFVFCSGTAGIDPVTGAVPVGIEAQTEQALLNLRAVLAAAGAGLGDLVKTTIYYTDVSDFQRLDAIYAKHMPDPPPARSAPANVRLPRGLLVSIDAIAIAPSPAR